MSHTNVFLAGDGTPFCTPLSMDEVTELVYEGFEKVGRMNPPVGAAFITLPSIGYRTEIGEEYYEVRDTLVRVDQIAALSPVTRGQAEAIDEAIAG